MRTDQAKLRETELQAETDIVRQLQAHHTDRSGTPAPQSNPTVSVPSIPAAPKSSSVRDKVYGVSLTSRQRQSDRAVGIYLMVFDDDEFWKTLPPPWNLDKRPQPNAGTLPEESYRLTKESFSGDPLTYMAFAEHVPCDVPSPLHDD